MLLRNIIVYGVLDPIFLKCNSPYMYISTKSLWNDTGVNPTRGYHMIFVNLYVPSIGGPKYTKQILIDLKGKRDSNKYSRRL